MTRRRFLAAAAGGGITAAASGLTASAPPQAGRGMTKLGLDLFSLRSQGWGAFELLDYSAKLGAQVVHFSEPRFLGSVEEAHLDKVKQHADRLGLELEAGFGSICPTSTRFNKEEGTAEEQLLRMFRIARRLGSPFVRCYLGSSQDREGPTPLEQHIENTIKTCRVVRAQAIDMNLKIAIENHSGDLQSRQLKMLIEEAGKDYVGALYDAGNATWTLEDPLHALETLAPYVLTSGFRDSAVWETETGAAVQWVAMGDGNVRIENLAKRYRELCPGKTFSLEIINLRSPRPFNYWQEDFWKNYRDVPGWVFARFQKLAKQGRPYMNVPPAPAGAGPQSPEFRQFMIEQERRDVEQAIRYSREKLKIGRG
jgi:sugar phosphate isomerase/epimerase